MKLAKKRLELVEKLAMLGGVFLILFVIGYYAGYFRTNCAQAAKCFNELLKKCRAAEFIGIKQNNVYQYVSYPSLSSTCNLKVTLKRVVVGAPQEFKDLEGKSMQCKVPRDTLETIELEKMNDLMKHCSGKLKEKLYEIIIQRMYSLVITQMDDIVVEAQKALEER